MSCIASPQDPDRCPGVDDILPQLIALLPRGRAWPTWPGTVLWKFWRAIALVLADLEARICALRAEFFCDTANETRPQWLAEYGLPDSCDPFPDLCAKVGATGGSTCAYFTAVAARAGWSVTCATVSGDPAGSLRLRITLASSPAYVAGAQTPFLAGCSGAGVALGCGPSIDPLECLFARILPAHLAIIWETV